MKKIYLEPELDVVLFTGCDVVCDSGGEGGGDEDDPFGDS